MVVSIGAVASASQGVFYYEKDGYYARDDPERRRFRPSQQLDSGGTIDRERPCDLPSGGRAQAGHESGRSPATPFRPCMRSRDGRWTTLSRPWKRSSRNGRKDGRPDWKQAGHRPRGRCIPVAGPGTGLGAGNGTGSRAEEHRSPSRAVAAFLRSLGRSGSGSVVKDSTLDAVAERQEELTERRTEERRT